MYYGNNWILWDGGVGVRKTEMTRLVELGNSFIQLGNALQQMEVQPPRQQTDIIQEIYNKVYQQVCQFCPKESWCWQEESSYTLEELSNACNMLEEFGLQKQSAFSTKFQGRCSRTGQLEIALSNQMEYYKQQQSQQTQLEESKANIANQLVLLGEQMQLMRTGNGSYEQTQRLLVGHASSKKEQVSGDSWGVQDLGDGRMVQILCDGMGSGELAMQQSKLAVHLLQTLLSGGLSMRLCLNMINTIMSFQYGGVRFSTMDIALWNLHSGKIELYKYGAAPSFVKNGRKVVSYDGSSLPVGILPRVECSLLEHTIAEGDLLITMSDGLYELSADGFQWEQIIGCLPTTNPQLAAEYLLAIATSRIRANQKKTSEQAAGVIQHADDMTVVVSRLF